MKGYAAFCLGMSIFAFTLFLIFTIMVTEHQTDELNMKFNALVSLIFAVMFWSDFRREKK